MVCPELQNYDSGVKYTNYAVDPAPAHVFFDAFHRTSGLGSAWQIANGGFTADGTYAVSGAPPIQGNWAQVTPILGTNDYVVSADIIIPPNSQASGLVARSSDPT